MIAVIVGIGIPLLLLVGVLAYISANAERLPADIALQWGTDGPDRFGTIEELLMNIGILSGALLLFSALMLAITASVADNRRLGAGIAAGIGSFLPLLTLATTVSQFDIATGREAELSNWGMLGAIGGSVVIGFAATILVPRPSPVPAAGPIPKDAPRLANADSSPGAVDAGSGTTTDGLPHATHSSRRDATSGSGGANSGSITWHGTAEPTRGVMIGILALFAPVLLFSIWLASGGMWVVLVIMLAVAALMVALMFFHVHIDHEGLTARSVIGFPTIRVPLDQVARADTREVSPFGEFGGWGYRTNGIETGIVTRKGEGVVIERASGGKFVVTVDDADTAARTLNTLASAFRS